ncbi:hypothetical protein IVB40_21940 [Bradyrhizobium sp. 40]|uniref:hypothetical protein n=1 Tax=Bradyrhizobium sp. 40 TaxID=2782674 RepID=UPI001FFFD4D5|nr:hypothetical protein [Bradyrhizobium sp. 40]UPJ39992.1 hypothetical protein IVB40_21940 [Bradyrhizobium sp. 40]
MTATITFFPVSNGDMTLLRFDNGQTFLVDVNIRGAADDENDDTPDVANELKDRKAPNVKADRTGTAGASAEDRAKHTSGAESLSEARLRTAGSGLCGSAAHRAVRGLIKSAGRLRPAPREHRPQEPCRRVTETRRA